MGLAIVLGAVLSACDAPSKQVLVANETADSIVVCGQFILNGQVPKRFSCYESINPGEIRKNFLVQEQRPDPAVHQHRVRVYDADHLIMDRVYTWEELEKLGFKIAISE